MLDLYKHIQINQTTSMYTLVKYTRLKHIYVIHTLYVFHANTL